MTEILTQIAAIGDGEGRVKIGWSMDPVRRLAKINSDCPGTAALLGAIEASKEQEAEAHQLLANWCIGGEWFRLEGAVAEFVGRLPPHQRPLAPIPITDPLIFIRKRILGISQTDMAQIAGVTQGTVSKWEAGEGSPCLAELARVRAWAIARGIPWEDSCFFEIPNSPGAP